MSKVKIVIDDMEVLADENKTILQAAEDSDIYIPHLCNHPELHSVGGCRLCVVDIKGKGEALTACTTKAEAGMIVKTKSEKLDEMRRLSMELMLANHVDDCTTCPKYLKCELQSLIQYLGVSTSRLRRTLNTVPVETENPLIIRDLNRCVACGRCVRACQDIFNTMGINTDNMVMADGSGLSRLDLVTPRQIVNLLSFMSKNDEFSKFYESLPIGGVDGTLINRMKKTAAENNVRAKAGYNNNVSSLSGYLKTLSGEQLVFSIIVNNYLAPSALVNYIEDNVCHRLVNFIRN